MRRYLSLTFVVALITADVAGIVMIARLLDIWR